MKDDICLDCILKSQNTRSVPLWQKKEGQDSLLPKIIRDDLYNPKKTELKKEHPEYYEDLDINFDNLLNAYLTPSPRDTFYKFVFGKSYAEKRAESIPTSVND